MVGGGGTGVIWLFNIVTYMLLDPLKFPVRFALSGRAWGLVVDQRVSAFRIMERFVSLNCLTNANEFVNCVFIYQTAFTNRKDYGKEAREAARAAEKRTLHSLQLQSTDKKLFGKRSTFSYRDVSLMAEEAKRRAEIARMRELHTLKGKVESFAKLRGFDIDAMNQNYTV